MSKRVSPALKSPPADNGLEGPEDPHLEMQQTAVGDVLGVFCTRISKQGGNFVFQADVEVNPKTTTPQPLLARLRDCR